jgi:hypothetical protein
METSAGTSWIIRQKLEDWPQARLDKKAATERDGFQRLVHFSGLNVQRFSREPIRGS